LTYTIEIKASATKQIRKLPQDLQEQIASTINDLATDPRPNGVKKLKNFDSYRVRVGDYRIIYQIQDNVLLIIVVRVGHRKDVYK